MKKKDASCNFDTLRALFAVLEFDRPEICFSGIHVQTLTKCFYEFLPFKFSRGIHYDQLIYGALFHDIGKIRIPKEIINKPGKLTVEERQLMKDHARIGAEILGKIPGLEKLQSWVCYHHERMDGKGYFGLKGKEIPLEARILAITDAYSSIIMASSFKPSRTHEDAISILRMGAGTQFDRELVKIFCSIPGVILSRATDEARAIIEKTRLTSLQGDVED